MSVDALIELYDSDIIVIEGVIDRLNARRKSMVNLDAFRREAVERFAESGFKVDVRCYTTTVEGVFAFDIEIADRCDPVIFDPDRQRHEVVNDLLGIDPSMKGQLIKPSDIGPKGKGFIIKDGHKHSHGEGEHQH